MFSLLILFFFFKQKTAYEMRISDWGSDVCSSDLLRRKAADRLGQIDIGSAVAGDRGTHGGQHAEGVVVVEFRERRHHDAAELQAEEAAARPDRKSVV